MKNKTISKATSLILAGSILLASCSSTTLIQSNPTGAKVYVNDEPVGTTPYKYSDTKILGSKTDVRLEKEGYETYYASFYRNEEVDVSAIIGGLFVWVPFLWTMQYKPTHTYELTPTSELDTVKDKVLTQSFEIKSKANRLRELKKLLDEKVITQEEFEKEKAKILEEKE